MFFVTYFIEKIVPYKELETYFRFVNVFTMARQKEGKKKSDKTAPASTAKEKKAAKSVKKQEKDKAGKSE